MNQVILESELIISRSGYSTIMDLAALGKKAIFVPTPGQMEQEYLANELMKKRIAFSMPQDNFNLQWALSEVEKYTGFNLKKENVGLSKTIERFINETN
jgi:UDP-N-acetylglucosamine:LPS N-acetylglucosamine transferase